MTDREHDEKTGQFDDRIPAEDALDAFERRDDLARPLTAGDVADVLGCKRRTALNKLNELVAAGSIESRRVGGRARVFWQPIPSSETARLKRLSAELAEPITVGQTVYEDGDSHPLDGSQEVANVPEDIDTPEVAEADESDESAAVTDVDALDLPGQGSALQDRQDALRAVLDVLEAEGEAKTAELKELAWSIDSETFGSADSLWKNFIYAGLAELDTVESSGTSGRWRWVGDT